MKNALITKVILLTLGVTFTTEILIVSLLCGFGVMHIGFGKQDEKPVLIETTVTTTQTTTTTTTESTTETSAEETTTTTKNGGKKTTAKRATTAAPALH